MSERTFDNFDDHAFQYRKIHTRNVKLSGADSFYFAKFKASLLAEYECNSPLQMLDLGCGDGAVEVYLNQQFPNYYINALDVSEKSIQMAKELDLPNVTFSTFDGKRIPFSDDTFDVVLVASVLHHIDFTWHQELLQEVRRVMKKGSRIYLFEHNPLNPFTRYIVKTCEFDKDARMLFSGYATKQLHLSGFNKVVVRFILFFPRFKWLRALFKWEKLFSKIPLGAQYMLRAEK